MKVGMCFNCDIRHNGTAAYAMRAMKEIEGIEAFHIRSPQPEGECPKADLYVYIDDGRDDISWVPPQPSAYWAIDTHLGYGYRLDKAKKFTKAFVAQLPAVKEFKVDGVKDVHWLPLACHPDAHLDINGFRERLGAEADLSTLWDIAFVGFMNDARGVGFNSRIEYLDLLQNHVPNTWISVGAFFEDMAYRFVRARMGFNISIRNDLNMRFFEVLSTGTPLLTNRNVVGLDELGFEEGVHYFGYHGGAEMVINAKEALGDEKARNEVGVAGHLKCRQDHTYHHRMLSLLEEMGRTDV